MNVTELVERARSLLTEETDAVAISREKLFALVPPAITALQTQILANPQKLDGFRADALVSIVQGSADLTQAVKTKGLRLDLLRSSDITLRYNDEIALKTVQFVSSLDRLTLGGIQDYLFVLAFVDGHKILFRDNSLLEAGDDPTRSLRMTATIRGVCLPDTVEKVPDYMEGELIFALAGLARQNAQSEKRRQPAPEQPTV